MRNYLYQYIIYDHFAFSDGDIYTQSNPYMYEENCEEDAKNQCNKLNDEACEDGRYGYQILAIPIVDLQENSIDEACRGFDFR